VGVVDKTGGSAVKVVANVPFGVAFLGSVTSTVGHTLTGLFETAFQVIPGVGSVVALLWLTHLSVHPPRPTFHCT
jgi:conjugal transfer mating pair stabilization protein TraG